jgi:small subunit ribosomal protein S4|tara:strand:+ start:25714 stop:26250 length:537 start_codon:yes stop_codon:yes gene_type:complete
MKPYNPGKKGRRRPRPLSEYGKELREKQKLKSWYNLGERQFKKYVKEILDRRGGVEDAAALLVQKLETRLDNIVYRLGFANSRSSARQLVSHGHLYVNNKPIDIPSYQLKKGDKVSIRSHSQKKMVFQNLSTILKKHKPPLWLEVDNEKLEGKVTGLPTLEEAAPPAEISSIFEFYSR